MILISFSMLKNMCRAAVYQEDAINTLNLKLEFDHKISNLKLYYKLATYFILKLQYQQFLYNQFIGRKIKQLLV